MKKPQFYETSIFFLEGK